MVTSNGQPGCDSGGSTSCVVQGLVNGVPYQFAVVAQNARGSSPSSSWSATVVPLGPPSAPQQVKVKAKWGKAKVSWQAPADNGGTAVTRYTVTASAANRGCSTARQSCVVKRLKHGKKMRFTVVAYNGQGAGPGRTSARVRIK